VGRVRALDRRRLPGRLTGSQTSACLSCLCGAASTAVEPVEPLMRDPMAHALRGGA
jgi:hypothetical protein